MRKDHRTRRHGDAGKERAWALGGVGVNLELGTWSSSEARQPEAR